MDLQDSCESSRSLDAIEDKLLEGQRALLRIRRNVSGFMVSVGVLLLITMTAEVRTEEIDHSRHEFISEGCTNVLAVLGGFAMLIAPLPNDMCLSRLVLLISAAWQVYFSGLVVLFAHGKTDFYVNVWCDTAGCSHPSSASQCCRLYECSAHFMLVRAGVSVIMLLCLAANMLSTTATKMQARMWNIWLVERVVAMVISTAAPTVLGLVQGGVLCTLAARVFGNVLAIVFCASPAIRGYVHTKIGNLFETRRLDSCAAGIAGLVGSCTTRDALARASVRFRCVSLDGLTLEELADNAPRPELFERSQKVALHDCDAFISHSWQDDAAAKWEALQSWRRDFLEENGREPRVWFDKCCIDQNDIESDLRCLPIFLAGCHELVVLSGTTYLTRLWCVLELFAFVHMNSDNSRITHVPVLREHTVESDAQAIMAAYKCFDARNTCCSKAEDKERILAIINTAFGGMSDFNAAVSAIISEARPIGAAGRSLRSNSLSSTESSSSDDDDESATEAEGNCLC